MDGAGNLTPCRHLDSIFRRCIPARRFLSPLCNDSSRAGSEGNARRASSFTMKRLKIHPADRSSESEDPPPSTLRAGKKPAKKASTKLESGGVCSTAIEKESTVNSKSHCLRRENGEPRQPARRYIAFVGGLPYHTTQFDVKQFFGRTVGPNITSVRLLTERGSNKPRGCAFVEFGSKESLAKALGFNGRELDGRKVRIELTVGGGGKGESRQAKLKTRRRLLRHLRKKKVRQTSEKRRENCLRKKNDDARPDGAKTLQGG